LNRIGTAERMPDGITMFRDGQGKMIGSAHGTTEVRCHRRAAATAA
jgi:hypothetical protein